MAAITVQDIALTGLEPTFAAATAGGDTVATTGSGRIFLWVENGDASPKQVTIDSVKECSQGFDHDGGGSVPAGERRLFGPLDGGRFGANAAVTYDDVTSVTVAAIRA